MTLPSDELRSALVQSLEGSKRFKILKPGERDAGLAAMHCSLELVFAREVQQGSGSAELRAEVGVSAEFRRPTELFQQEASGFGRATFAAGDGTGRSKAFQKALFQALDQAVDGHVLQLVARGKTETALIKDLGSADSRVRDYAVRELAERKNAAAVPALIERLSDSDREVALRAAGALGTIGDPSAVPALIEMTQSRDMELIKALVGVIASIGGKDAEAFLFTLASGHPDEDVRHAAEQAQEQLRGRALKVSPPSSERSH
jgi:hypothetical protein